MDRIEQFIDQQRALGRYSFSYKLLKEAFDKSDKALKQSLYRLKAKGKIMHIKSGFYIIIPPEYALIGIIPTSLFIDDLMKTLKKQYYVALFSAASLQGATHLAIMELYVMTDYPSIRNIQQNNLRINFFTKKDWPKNLIIQRKTDTGYINLSCPELTTIDLLTYGNFSVQRVSTILEELTSSFEPIRLRETLRCTAAATIQRLGYLLHVVVGVHKFDKIIQQELDKRKIFPVLLSKSGTKSGILHPEWQVVENVMIESDL